MCGLLLLYLICQNNLFSNVPRVNPIKTVSFISTCHLGINYCNCCSAKWVPLSIGI